MDATVRTHAAEALSRLLNRTIDAKVIDPDLTAEERLRSLLALTQQAAPLHRGDRAAWMIEGFARAGYKVKDISADNAWEILRAFGAGDPYSYNAGRALTRIALGNAEVDAGTGKKKASKPPVFEETSAECRYWLKWIESHRQKLHLSKAPDNIGAACR